MLVDPFPASLYKVLFPFPPHVSKRFKLIPHSLKLGWKPTLASDGTWALISTVIDSASLENLSEVFFFFFFLPIVTGRLGLDCSNLVMNASQHKRCGCQCVQESPVSGMLPREPEHHALFQGYCVD